MQLPRTAFGQTLRWCLSEQKAGSAATDCEHNKVDAAEIFLEFKDINVQVESFGTWMAPRVKFENRRCNLL